MDSANPSIYELSLSELIDVIREWGYPDYRAKQIWHGLYRNLWTSPHEFTDLPQSLRQRLEDHFSFTNLRLVDTITSVQGDAEKFLFALNDGQRIEAVLMYYDIPCISAKSSEILRGKQPRRSLCVSSQVGCALGCVFCATGQMGFHRNLKRGEIIEQVLFSIRHLRITGESLTHITFMGMGEPFHNYDAVLSAIDQLNHPEGLNIGARRFTISTAGLVPKIRRFTKEQRQINLAVSLHAADNDLRNQLMPINRKYPIEELMDACREYTQRTKRRITFEWALIDHVNDHPSQAQKLSRLLHGILCHVNLISLNPSSGYTGIGSNQERVIRFQNELLRLGIPCTVRVRRGTDIQAGCGQLATHYTTLIRSK